MSRLLKQVALILLLGWGIIGCRGEDRRTVSMEKPPLAAHVIPLRDSVPLLVMGSYLCPRENILIADLKSGLETGGIVCTKDVAAFIRKTFKLIDNPRIISLNQFPLWSRDALVVTSIDSVDQRFLALRLDSVDFFKRPLSYPLWKTLETGSFNAEKQITTYVHTGVTALTRLTGVVLNNRGIDFYLANILPFFTEPEIVHVSNEVSLKDDCDYGSMRLQFATKAAHFEVLRKIRTSIVELTGNHNLDVGVEPYLRTFDWYDRNGIRYFGGGRTPSSADRPLVMELKDGSKVAWVGYNQRCPLNECADRKPGANRYREEKAAKTIDSLRNIVGVNYVLACVQFEETDSYTPTFAQRAISRKLIELGADVVLGSQAHQPQEIELYKGRTIFFGLGNFMFDQLHRVGVRQAFFLEGYFYKGQAIQLRPVYTYMNSARQPTPATESEKSEIKKMILKDAGF